MHSHSLAAFAHRALAGVALAGVALAAAGSAPAALAAQVAPGAGDATAIRWSLTAGMPTEGSGDGSESPFLALGATWQRPTTGFAARLELIYGASGVRTPLRLGMNGTRPGVLRESTREVGLLGAMQYEFLRGSRVRPYVFAGGGLAYAHTKVRLEDVAGDVGALGCAGASPAGVCTNGKWSILLQSGIGAAVRVGRVELLPELRVMRSTTPGRDLDGVAAIGIRF